MINVYDMLYSLCEDERVYNPDCELIDSGILDSFALISLFSMLEDEGIVIHLTRIEKTFLKTSGGIEQLVKEALKKTL